MAEQIQADYEILEQIAAKFTSLQEMFAEDIRNIESHAANLDQEWIGNGFNAFTGRMDELILPSCHQIAEALTEASAVTREISATIRDAEEQAADQFEMLA